MGPQYLKYFGKKPVNCRWVPVDGPVGDWSGCSTSCGRGTRTRKVQIHPPQHGGKQCPRWTHDKIQREGCTVRIDLHDPKFCPLDCQVLRIGEWSACSATCGEGIEQRIIRIRSAMFGGSECEDDNGREISAIRAGTQNITQTNRCKIKDCPREGRCTDPDSCNQGGDGGGRP